MVRKLIVAFALVATLVAVLPGFASAHAELERSLPEPGSVIELAPAQVEIWFTEELAGGSTATVSGPNGERVDNDDAEIDLFDPKRKHLVVTLQPGLPAGEYTVEWTTVSGEDEDTETGSYTFSVTESATPVASPAASLIASPSSESSPESTGQSPVVTQANSETTKPNSHHLLIALAVGFGAAAFIYGFWLLVKPRGQ
jgi:methionine-rich copper-binding protein CopC